MMPADSLPADGVPALTSDQVQVWTIDLDTASLPEADYLRTLSAAEQQRAARLRPGQVRLQFAVGRSCLRSLLGAELGLPPEKVPIVTGAYGKPLLDDKHGERVHFNVAHSRSTILIALSLAAPVGIDVEYLDRDTDILEVARHSLTQRETSALLAIDDPQQRNRAFFECWTRKEAIVKADGRGLSLPLNSFEVPVRIACHSLPITLADAGSGPGRRHFLTGIALSLQTACAVAVADRPVDIVFRTLPLSPN